MSQIMVFSGNANPALAQAIAQILQIPLGQAQITCYADGELNVAIHDNVRGTDVFIIQSTCAPTNTHLMELMLLVDAIKRASAARITAVIPYFGYARQDRRVRSARVPISAKVVADMLVGVGIHRVLTVDLHADAIQGFFSVPVDNAYASPLFETEIRDQAIEHPQIVSPDIGGVVRARAFAKRLDGTDLAIIDKRRPCPNQAEVMHIIGEVTGRHCLLIDDMVDTANTLCLAANALKQAGAASIRAYVTHAVLSQTATTRIQHSAIDQLIVTDSIPVKAASHKIKVLSLAPLLAEMCQRIHTETSLSDLY